MISRGLSPPYRWLNPILNTPQPPDKFKLKSLTTDSKLNIHDDLGIQLESKLEIKDLNRS